MNRRKLAVIFGGRSGEHEVSLVSAASVLAALDATRYAVLPVGIAKDGRWFAGPGAHAFLRNAADPTSRSLSAPMIEGTDWCRPCMLSPDPELRSLLLRDRDAWIARSIDVAFPLVHGTFGEDGTLQGLLEVAGVPYIGAGVLASAMAMDKIVQKRLHAAAGLPVPRHRWFRGVEYARDAEAELARTEDELGYPVFVKPPNMGSSVGIGKAATRAELRAAVDMALAYDGKVLVEAAVPAAREIEIAVLGNEDPIASVPGEVVPSNEFYDYDAKYVDGASRLDIPATLPDDVAARARDMAIEAYRALDCEGMARVDFLLDGESGALYVNEVNTIPGFTSISMYPKLLAAIGIPFEQLLDRLVDLALERHTRRAALRTSYTPRQDWHRRGED
jgi:D-alanine-D-alanine ligase